MKRTLRIFFLIVFVLSTFIPTQSYAAQSKEKFNIGSDFKEPGIGLDKGWYIYDHKQADVNGDTSMDDVLVAGSYDYPGANGFNELCVVIYTKGKYRKICDYKKPGTYYGINLLDFNYDRVKDIHIMTEDGTLGGIIYRGDKILTYKANECRTIYDNKAINRTNKIKGFLLNKYKVKFMTAGINKKTITIDFSGSKSLLEKLKVYKNGKPAIHSTVKIGEESIDIRAKTSKKTGFAELEGFKELYFIPGDKHEVYGGKIKYRMQYNLKSLKWCYSDLHLERDN